MRISRFVQYGVVWKSLHEIYTALDHVLLVLLEVLIHSLFLDDLTVYILNEIRKIADYKQEKYLNKRNYFFTSLGKIRSIMKLARTRAMGVAYIKSNNNFTEIIEILNDLKVLKFKMNPLTHKKSTQLLKSPRNIYSTSSEFHQPYVHKDKKNRKNIITVE